MQRTVLTYEAVSSEPVTFIHSADQSEVYVHVEPTAASAITEPTSQGPKLNVIDGTVYGDADTGHEAHCSVFTCDEIKEQMLRRNMIVDAKTGMKPNAVLEKYRDQYSTLPVDLEEAYKSFRPVLHRLYADARLRNSAAVRQRDLRVDAASRLKCVATSSTQTCPPLIRTASASTQAGNRPWHGRRCTWAVINRTTCKDGLQKPKFTVQPSNPFTWITLEQRRKKEARRHRERLLGDEHLQEPDDAPIDVESPSQHPTSLTPMLPTYATLYNDTQELRHVLRILQKRARSVLAQVLRRAAVNAAAGQLGQGPVCLHMPSEWLVRVEGDDMPDPIFTMKHGT